MDIITFAPTDHFVSLSFYLGPLVKAVMKNMCVLFDKACLLSCLCQRKLSFHDIVLNIFFSSSHLIQSANPQHRQMFSFYCDSANIQHIIYSQTPQKSSGVNTVLIYPKVFKTEPNNMQQPTR